MASVLEQLGIATRGLEETVQPFLPWAGSPIQEWTVTLRMLNAGDLISLAEKTSGVSPMEAAYLSKIHLLATALVSINGRPIVNEEDVESYNKEHNLTGVHEISLYDYKVLFIKKLTELVVNRLAFAYDEMQDKYVSKILGKPLPDELRTANASGVDLSTVGTDETDEEDNTTDQDNTGARETSSS